MRYKTIFYHFLFWFALYATWILLFRSYSVVITTTMSIEFCYLIFITADYYIISDTIIPHLLRKERYTLFTLLTFSLIIGSGWLRARVAEAMNQNFFHLQLPSFSDLFFNSVVNIALWVLIVTMGKMMIDRAQTQKRLELLESERLKSELEFLRLQINPHALFNSLNTIYGHIDKNNLMARSVLLNFSELLRYQLYECNAEKISLEKELTYIKKYVEFQQLRKPGRLVIELDLTAPEDSLYIAPLLLIVPIENAFKFVSHSLTRENRIVIRISTREKILHALIANTKEGISRLHTIPAGGIGLINLKRRLELLYSKKHEMKTQSSDNWYEANLTIDLA